MKRLVIMLSMILMLAAARADAYLNVVGAYPWIADLSARIGGERVHAVSLSQGTWNPHFVVPRPSLISVARDADLLIINGAQLEIGWLPPIVRESRNPRIQQGRKGLLDLSAAVTLIEVPKDVSRAGGDVHPEGNPHYVLDPHNMPALASAVAARLSLIDPEGSAYYDTKLRSFLDEWAKSLSKWDGALKAMKGVKVISYHTLYNYLIRRYGMTLTGTIEPLPGIPPSSRHIEMLLEHARAEKVGLYLQDVYNPSKPARLLAEKTGARMIVLPHDVGAVSEATDIFALFDAITRRLMK